MATDLKNIQDQINAKMHWGDSEEEIEDWLREKHSIEGERADAMILKGINDRKAGIRKTCLIRMIVALIAAIPLGLCSLLALQNDGYSFKYGILLGTLCFSCLGYVAHNLLTYIKGKSDISIDA